MLDAFIIDRIRREREAPKNSGLLPPRIEAPRPRPVGHRPVRISDDAREPRGDHKGEAPKRGVVIIDFNI